MSRLIVTSIALPSMAARRSSQCSTTNFATRSKRSRAPYNSSTGMRMFSGVSNPSSFRINTAQQSNTPADLRNARSAKARSLMGVRSSDRSAVRNCCRGALFLLEIPYLDLKWRDRLPLMLNKIDHEFLRNGFALFRDDFRRSRQPDNSCHDVVIGALSNRLCL